MRRLVAFLAPMLALSACQAPAYAPAPDTYYDRSSERWADDQDVALGARIVPRATSDFAVELNRPAYVAVFEILPGRGVGLLYPRYDGENAYLPSGYSYLDSNQGRLHYEWYTGTRLGGRYSRTEPRFYFLVASRRPLRISRFQRGGDGALRSVLGLAAYSAVDYRTVMNDLVTAIVPYQPNTDWSTDVYAVWPDQGYDYYYASYPNYYTRIDCGDGYYEVLPWELSRYACARYRRGPEPNGPPPQRDTTVVQGPTRHRPQPTPPPADGDGTRRPRPLNRPVDDAPQPFAPRSAGGDGPRVAPNEGPRREPPADPRQAPRFEPPPAPPAPPAEPESPREQPKETPAESPPPRAPRVEPPPREPRFAPRDEPKPEPRATPREEPRSEPRPEPRRPEPVERREPPRETPRYEPRSEPRSEPRAEPRSEPVRITPPPPPPSPPPAPAPTRSEPAPTRSEPAPRAEPAAPAPRLSAPTEPAR